MKECATFGRLGMREREGERGEKRVERVEEKNKKVQGKQQSREENSCQQSTVTTQL